MKGRLALCAALIVLAGCSRGGSAAGKAGLPASGQVKVVATKIREDADHFSWLWTIVGERNWTQPTASSGEMRLSGSHPLNSREKSGGTHIWEARVTVEPSKAGSRSSYVMQVHLRGTNANVASSGMSIELGSGATVASVARAIQADSTTVSLPATLTLATVARREIKLKIDR